MDPNPNEPATTRIPVVPIPEPEDNVIAGVTPRPGDKELRVSASANQPIAAPIFARPTPPPAPAQPTQPATQSTQQPNQAQQTNSAEPRTISQEPKTNAPLDAEEKIFAAVGYVGILALLPLLARRDSEYCQHHGRQALVIAIFFIIFDLFAGISTTLAIIMLLLQLIAIIGGGVFAYRGEWFRVPLIYDLSLKLKLDKKE